MSKLEDLARRYRAACRWETSCQDRHTEYFEAFMRANDVADGSHRRFQEVSHQVADATEDARRARADLVAYILEEMPE